MKQSCKKEDESKQSMLVDKLIMLGAMKFEHLEILKRTGECVCVCEYVCVSEG